MRIHVVLSILRVATKAQVGLSARTGTAYCAGRDVYQSSSVVGGHVGKPRCIEPPRWIDASK